MADAVDTEGGTAPIRGVRRNFKRFLGSPRNVISSGFSAIYRRFRDRPVFTDLDFPDRTRPLRISDSEGRWDA
ncbi:hypothetical protein A4G99_04210 [Haladaptatus sp. R4]|nr:hypothetical protein A4G99_04210 [Haladaptatus sp. R4]